MTVLRRLEVVLISLISVHSFILGFSMLFWPVHTLAFFGWDYEGPMFFPSQTGVFLVLFACAYLAAIWNRAFTRLILGSKAMAVAFLVGEYILLGPDAPGTVLAAAVLDGLMGAAMGMLMLLKCGQDVSPQKAA